MQNSIENRVPYLDSILVDLTFKWKEDFFYRNGDNKFLLRKVSDLNLNNFSKVKFHKPGNYSFVYSILSKDIKKILINKIYRKKNNLKNLYYIYQDDLNLKTIKMQICGSEFI